MVGGTFPVLGPSFQFTSLVPNEVFVGFNLREALSIILHLWKSNAFGFQRNFAELNCQSSLS